MNFIRFNRPVSANPFAHALDELFSKGLSELTQQSFVSNKPSVNILENDDAFTVELAAPGLKKEDFEIKIDKDQLTIKVASKTENSEDTEGTEEKIQYKRREFDFNSFTRSFHLPETVNTEAIHAGYEDGVLSITLNKKEEAKPQEPRMIAIS